MAKVGKKLKTIRNEIQRLWEDDQALLEEVASLRDDNGALLGEVALLRGEGRELMEGISRLRERESAESAAVSGGNTEILQQEMRSLSREFQKHDLAIADMLETWEEWREAREEDAASAQAELLQKSREETRALQEREDAMTEALICGLDQYFVLKTAARAAGDSAWLRQLTLADSAVREKCLAAGLQVVGEEGETFSYEQHEPVEKIYTALPERHLTIARVISRGYWMRGKRLRKAQVSVYVLKEEEEA